MAKGVKTRLSVMMFLEYVIWGSWLPLLALYLSQFLHFSGTDIGWIFATQAIASVTAVFVSGQLADRYCSTERFLAVEPPGRRHRDVRARAARRRSGRSSSTMLVYMLVYVPTLSLTNSICFHHLKDAQKEFGRVRLWGTIGWIAASWPFVFILKGKAGAGAGGGAERDLHRGRRSRRSRSRRFSLLLPPDAARAAAPQQQRAASRRSSCWRAPSVAVLFVVTFLDALVHQCYFQWTSPFLAAIGVPENWIMPAMSIGQIAEIATMAGARLLPEAAGLAQDDDHRHPGPRAALLRLLDRPPGLAGGGQQPASTASATRSSSPRSTSSWTSTSRRTRGPAPRASSTS